MVAHDRLIEPRVTIEGLLAKPRSFSNLPAFVDHNGRRLFSIFRREANFSLKLSGLTFEVTVCLKVMKRF